MAFTQVRAATRAALRRLPLVLTLAGMVLLPGVAAEGFLGGARASRQVVSLQARSEELQAAMTAVLGCTAGSSPHATAAQAATARKALLPIWRALPKNQYGRVEWKTLRYMAHRYFMQRFSVLVRGLEPTRQVNNSHAGEAEILNQKVPELARRLMEGPQALHGFSLEDAVAMVAALEQLIFDSESSLLEVVYKRQGLLPHQAVNRLQLKAVLKEFMIHWLMGEVEDLESLLADEQHIKEVFPNWHEVDFMLDGSIRAAEFAQRRAPRAGSGHSTMGGQYSFEDALALVAGIGRGFASFWETQCQDIKASLVAMDTSATGRVRLSEFYGANMGGEWRFGESEAYLRELGALDESSSWRGKQVVISNYLQAASNCIVSRPQYLVCCVNECEEILGEVEAAVGAPVAHPEDVLQVVGNMTSYEDDPAPLSEALRLQLKRVADTHGGKVPLHGRLFAQWLHYVFPRECPFPHKAGVTSAVTPSQFGDNYVATAEEVSKHIAEQVIQEDLRGVAGTRNSSLEEAHWMTQWTEEEELPGDYTWQLHAPWEGSAFLVVGGAAAAATGTVALLWAASAKAGHGPASGGKSLGTRSHFV